MYTSSHLSVYEVGDEYWNVFLFQDELQVEGINSKTFCMPLPDFDASQCSIVDIGLVFILITSVPIPILCKLIPKTPKLNV
jgi:hypothetical protein